MERMMRSKMERMKMERIKVERIKAREIIPGKIFKTILADPTKTPPKNLTAGHCLSPYTPSQMQERSSQQFL